MVQWLEDKDWGKERGCKRVGKVDKETEEKVVSQREASDNEPREREDQTLMSLRNHQNIY